ncbi:MAG: radical SAM family heme chaperone HemW, partial [Thermodesulfobacteriota bacterium]
KCPYCDFYSITDTASRMEEWMDAWLAACLDEIRMAEKPCGMADTIYMGGGTPSLLGARRIGRLLDGIGAHFAMGTDIEVTLEVNPGTVNADVLRDYRAAGVNRLNIGVQTFDDENLRFLGRIHSSEEAFRSVRGAQQTGFDNIGLDLIYALPGQTRKAWQKDLETALAFSPAHLSCYSLTYAPGTPMTQALERGEFDPLPEEACADLFLFTHDLLASRGYPPYEISNFARNAFSQSRHNRKYWEDAAYIGLGPAAHSYNRGRRWWNVASVDGYADLLRAGRLPVLETERLSAAQMMIEAVYLGLRRTAGISTEDFASRFGVDFKIRFADALDHYLKAGCLCLTPDTCTLTRTGMLYADTIAAGFIDCL